MSASGHLRRPSLWLLLAAVLLAAPFQDASAADPGAAGARFVVPHHAVDSGGGRSSSARFEIVSAIGVGGPASLGSSASFLDRRGFAAQLNEFPVAGEDLFSAQPGASLQIPFASLLANDADPDDPNLGVVGVSSVSANGVPMRLVGGAVFYDAPPGDTLTDRFAYVLTDGIDQTEGEVVIVKSAPSPINLRIARVAAGGGDLITFLGAPGRSYQIQIAASLVPPVVWSDFGAPLAAAGDGLAERTDATPVSPRFYRAREQ